MTESALEFPSDFPIKVMGLAVADFAQTVVEIVLRHAPDYDPAATEMRPSRAGKYLGVTCVIRAISREQLDAIYRELSAHPAVRVVL